MNTSTGNIIMIGMPGSGKSTLGVLLAKSANKNFMDTDIVIQEKEGRLLKEIITEEGLDGFISIENRINSEIEADNTVIAPGGSVVYGAEAMKHFSETGIIVYLKLSYKTISERLGDLKERGVALKDGMTLLDLYKERCVLYERYADIIIDCENKDIGTILSEIKEKIHTNC